MTERDTNPILAYRQEGVARRKLSPHALKNIWIIALLLTMPVMAFTIHFHFENHHFKEFFPRKGAPEGKGYPLPFKHDLVTDESSWRWYIYVTYDSYGAAGAYIQYQAEKIFTHPLSPVETLEMRARIADNNRWNSFVDFVQHFGWPNLLLSILLAGSSATLLYELDRQRQPCQFYSVYFFSLVAATAFLQLMGRGYLILSD